MFERFVIDLLNGIFLQTVGSWGAFIVDEEGNIADDWSSEDENKDTSDLPDRTVHESLEKTF